MVHFFFKRILKMQKTMRILHSPSSFACDEEDEGDSQMVKVTSMKFAQQSEDSPTIKKSPTFFSSNTKKSATPDTIISTTADVADVESPVLTTRCNNNNNNEEEDNDNDADNDSWEIEPRRIRCCYESSACKIVSTIFALCLLILVSTVLLTFYFRQSHLFSSDKDISFSISNVSIRNSSSHLNSSGSSNSNSSNTSIDSRIIKNSTPLNHVNTPVHSQSDAKTKRPPNNNRRSHPKLNSHNEYSVTPPLKKVPINARDRKGSSANVNVDLKKVSRLSWDMLNGRYPTKSSITTTTPEPNIITINHNNDQHISYPHQSSYIHPYHQGKFDIAMNSHSELMKHNANVQNNDNDNERENESVLNTFPSQMPDESEVILPSVIYTSGHPHSNVFKTLVKDSSQDNVPPPSTTTSLSSSPPHNKKKSCCRTQKYTQTVKVDGCDTVTIVNKMCFGQCVSVWVPGLFASFPVCKPSRTTTKIVTLNCGQGKKKKVKIEKVRRCSCMEITEPK